MIWGYNWIAMKVGLAYAGPFKFAGIRFLLAAIVLIPIALWQREPLLPARSHWKPILILGVGLAGNFGACFTALKIGGVGKTAVLVYTMPIWVLIFAHLFLHETLSRWQWTSVWVAAAGLAVLIGPWDLHGGAIASVIAVAGGMFWGATVAYVKHLQKHHSISTLMLTLWQMMIGAIIIASIGLLYEAEPIRWTPEFIAALGYTVILGSVLGWLLFYYALRRLPAGLASLGTLATPIIGVLAAAAQLGERPSTSELSGMLLIVAALAMLAWTPRRSAA